MKIEYTCIPGDLMKFFMVHVMRNMHEMWPIIYLQLSASISVNVGNYCQNLSYVCLLSINACMQLIIVFATVDNLYFAPEVGLEKPCILLLWNVLIIIKVEIYFLTLKVGPNLVLISLTSYKNSSTVLYVLWFIKKCAFTDPVFSCLETEC